MSFDPEDVRHRFPALSETDDGSPRIYFDNPAGTQIPESVANAVRDCLLESSANMHGQFETSRRVNRLYDAAHQAMADMLNAASPNEIVFGQNMTTLTFHVSRSIGRLMKAGDHIVLSRMEHDGNISPWLLLARDLGLEVRWIEFNTDTYEFDRAAIDDAITEKAKIVCIGGASNMLGTINDVEYVVRKAKAVGALTYVDAVQSVPHIATDVQALGCDFLVCSAYKFFGPHQGVLWGRLDLLNDLEPYKLQPAPDVAPGSFETGTQNHEGMAGTIEAVRYFEWIGESFAADLIGRYSGMSARAQRVHAAMDCLFEYEATIAERLIHGLQQISGIRIHGVTDNDAMNRRVPTVSFTVDGVHADVVARKLGERNIFAWSGNMYALEMTNALGLADTGGVVRLGPVHYNTLAEVDTVVSALADILPRAQVA